MLNLEKYEGDFLKFAENEFDFSADYRQNFGTDISALKLTISCLVGIFPSKTDDTIVEIDAEDLENFNIYRELNTLVIKENNQSNIVITSNKQNLTISGGNMSNVQIAGIAGNNITQIMVGKEFFSSSKFSSQKLPRIRIFTSQKNDLKASISNNGILVSKIALGTADLEMTGNSSVGLSVTNIDIDMSGKANCYIICDGGSIEIDISGQGKATCKGDFQSADINISGVGKVRTSGTCQGNYKAKLSGMGSIEHSGQVLGKIKKKISGMGSISGL